MFGKKEKPFTMRDAARRVMPEGPCNCGSPKDAAATGIRLASQDHDSACHIWYLRVHLAAAMVHARAMAKASKPHLTEAEHVNFTIGAAMMLAAVTNEGVSDMSLALMEAVADPKVRELYEDFLRKSDALPTIIPQ